MDDRIKLLRSIHFSMLLLSFAVFVTVNYDSDAGSQKALHDLQIIQSSLHNWNQKFLLSDPQNRCSNALSQSKVTAQASIDAAITAAVDAYLRTTPCTLHPVSEAIRKKDFLNEFNTVYSNQYPQQTIANWAPVQDFGYSIIEPKNLQQFIELWNALDDKLRVTRIGTNIKAFQFYQATDSDTPDMRIDNVAYQQTDIDNANNAALSVDTLSLHYNMQTSSPLEFVLIADASTGDKQYKLLVRTELLEFYVDGQALYNSAHDEKLRRGTFKDAYYQLDRTTNKLQSLDFSVLHNVITSEIERKRDQVELAGVKIPSSEVAKWGIPLIVIIQWYFLAHLTELLRVWQTDNKQPWILLYKGRYATIGSVITLLFPLFVVIWLLALNLTDLAITGLLGKLLGVVCMVLTALHLIRYVELKRKV